MYDWVLNKPLKSSCNNRDPNFPAFGLINQIQSCDLTF